MAVIVMQSLAIFNSSFGPPVFSCLQCCLVFIITHSHRNKAQRNHIYSSREDALAMASLEIDDTKAAQHLCYQAY